MPEAFADEPIPDDDATLSKAFAEEQSRACEPFPDDDATVFEAFAEERP